MKNQKEQITFQCSNCSETFSKWSGECPNCHSWNTLSEVAYTPSRGGSSRSQGKLNLNLGNIEIANINSLENKNINERISSSNKAWDNILSGGMTPGQVILFSGDPGIGKSTLLLQIVSKIKDLPVLYFSGEETTQQVISRAKRIGNNSNEIFQTAEFVNLNDVEELESIVLSKNYKIVIVDSIQTISSSQSSGFPGSVNQIRECTLRIAEIAKRNHICFVIVGQVTKEGDIAGPKLLEHLVDTVLYLEGDRRSDLRILRVIKNRYGNTNEIAFFEMLEDGLRSVDNPSNLIIDRNKNLLEGSCYSLAMEGNVPIILEVQALCNKSVFNYPKFVSTGYPLNRLQMLAAIISKRTKINLSDQDIYVNIIGGIKIADPQVDLGICMAIASSYFKKSIDKNNIYFGEIGLTGEVRFNKTLKKREDFSKKNDFYSGHFNKVKSLSEFFRELKT